MKPEEFAGSVGRSARLFGMDLSRPLAMVSGGPDSVAMLRALVEIGAPPVVLHVDHGLRGEESREDARFVRDLCGRLGVPFEERRVEIGGSNLQEQARRERYRLAEEILEERGLSAIFTGHTADDVAETVLLNLARGAGLRGLSGIPPVRGRVVRPLIEHRRAEVLAYLSLLDQPYRTDPTNAQPKYARNRVRLEVLPVLEELYPGAVGNVIRGAALAREDVEALEEIATRDVHWRWDRVSAPLYPFARRAVAVRRYTVRHAYSMLLPEAPPLDLAHVEAVLELAGSGRLGKLDLPGNVTVARGPGELAFYRKEAPFRGEIELQTGVQEFAGRSVGVRELPASMYDPGDAARPRVAYLDASKGPFSMRMAREGDTIRPLGLGGTKKVLRAMKDRKVPEDLRRKTPMVVDAGGRVVWIFGGELSEDFKVGEVTQTMLRLEVQGNP